MPELLREAVPQHRGHLHHLLRPQQHPLLAAALHVVVVLFLVRGGERGGTRPGAIHGTAPEREEKEKTLNQTAVTDFFPR